MNAIFRSHGLEAHVGLGMLAHFRHLAEAENDWIIGRELIRHGRRAEGRRFLRRSVRAAPGLKRMVMLTAMLLPLPRIGPFRPYSAPEAV